MDPPEYPYRPVWYPRVLLVYSLVRASRSRLNRMLPRVPVEYPATPLSADRVPVEYTVHRVKQLRERPTVPVEYPQSTPRTTLSAIHTLTYPAEVPP